MEDSSYEDCNCDPDYEECSVCGESDDETEESSLSYDINDNSYDTGSDPENPEE